MPQGRCCWSESANHKMLDVVYISVISCSFLARLAHLTSCDVHCFCVSSIQPPSSLVLCVCVIQSAVGHDYQSKLSKHCSQVDTSKGFGGKFGVQADRVDQV